MPRACFRCGQAILFRGANSKAWFKLVEISNFGSSEENYCSRECVKEQLERDKIADEKETPPK